MHFRYLLTIFSIPFRKEAFRFTCFGSYVYNVCLFGDQTLRYCKLSYTMICAISSTCANVIRWFSRHHCSWCVLPCAILVGDQIGFHPLRFRAFNPLDTPFVDSWCDDPYCANIRLWISAGLTPSTKKKHITACLSSMMQSLRGASIRLNSLCPATRRKDTVLRAAIYLTSHTHA